MRGLTLRLVLITVFTLLLTSNLVPPIAAQATTCPPQALLSIARAGAACVNLEAGMACYGSGTVISTPASDSAAQGLANLGDRRPLRDLASVQVLPAASEDAANAPVSLASLAIRTSPKAADVIHVLLVADAEIRSEVTPPVELTMQAVGALHVRAAPTNDAAIIAEMGVNNRVIANGRYGSWVRVIVPSTGAIGWVSASLLRTNDSVSNLPEVEPDQEVAQPFQIVEFLNRATSACDGLLPAGALLQTPSTDLATAVTLTLNGVTIRLGGTAFVTQQDESLMVIVLDGIAELRLNGSSQFVPAGGQATVTLTDLSSIVPYDAVLTAALPVNNLPRRFQVTPPQAQEALDARIAALNAPTPTPVRVEPTPSNTCRRTVARRTTIWSGPGDDYEALTHLEAGVVIRPVLATTNPRGEVWWQLADSGWIARANVSERGDCSALSVPSVGRVAAPRNNTYSLERCASTNGPVRAGQRVTFEFIPPAWDNWGEARAATRTDPGHFELNGRRYYASASEPFRLGAAVDPLEDRYLRRFTMIWAAEPGTYRIIGDWLSYEPSCNLTVPVE